MTVVAPSMTWIDLDANASVLAHGIEWLTPQERSNADRFVSDQLQQRAKAARIYLRAMLARYLHQHPAQIEIATGKYGKPEIKNGPQFNLSHAGSVAVLALHPSLSVGVDVEQLARATSQMNLSSSLSLAERKTPPNDSAAWLRLWVRKEAAVKALGMGLNADLTSFDVGHDVCDMHVWRNVLAANGPALQLAAGCLPTGDPMALALVSPVPPKDGIRLETSNSVALISAARLLAGQSL